MNPNTFDLDIDHYSIIDLENFLFLNENYKVVDILDKSREFKNKIAHVTDNVFKDRIHNFLKDQEFDLFVGEREWCLDCYKNKYCGKCKLNLPFKIPYIVAKSNAKFDCRNNLYFPDHCEYFYFSLDL